ncbi:MAG TPA: hypothetical protein PLD20_15295 [Blastocatellia bacterium]|nr:hypothetical protein [Blastocatellia bacterium]HMV87452.1 hypothetical protein [Blastocatellia bacterium]HMX25010.1 hypothetical protein [Blastocatellia bacterium]HMY72569.1 hypothetical protein [Blastocatellia bacterium]HMZ19300.1 hypothetical protein [Blastocatellia bacterium]
MSAKITVVVYILISFEIGILLMIIPWKPYWDDNFFLYFITGKLHAAWMATFLKHKLVRGAVSGLGVLNILAGIYDIIKFRESVRKLSALGEDVVAAPAMDNVEAVKKEVTPIETATSAAAAVSDHRPPSVPPQA